MSENDEISINMMKMDERLYLDNAKPVRRGHKNFHTVRYIPHTFHTSYQSTLNSVSPTFIRKM